MSAFWFFSYNLLKKKIFVKYWLDRCWHALRQIKALDLNFEVDEKNMNFTKIWTGRKQHYIFLPKCRARSQGVEWPPRTIYSCRNKLTNYCIHATTYFFMTSKQASKSGLQMQCSNQNLWRNEISLLKCRNLFIV